MLSTKVFTSTLLLATLVGCGGNTFNGESESDEQVRGEGNAFPSRNAPLTPQAASIDRNQQQVYRINPEALFDNSPDGQALKACFNEWGETPFDETSAKNFKRLSSKSTGFGSKNISDRAKTQNPALILVDVNAVGFSSYRIDLGNPNGWYCIKSSAKGFSSFEYLKQCRAQIGNMQDEQTGFGRSQFTEYGENC